LGNKQTASTKATVAESLYVDTDVESEVENLFQSETRLISHEQLIAEVRDIYVGLVMIEAKCIDMNKNLSMKAEKEVPSHQKRLSNEK
jgi:hypothetical protein